MSTKIYNAYCWEGAGGVEGLLKRLTALRARVFKRSVIEASARFTPENFDLIKYMDDIRAVMKTGMCFTAAGNTNHSCSATVHFYKGQIYVIFFSLPREIKGVPFLGLSDFHYQNQTDRDDGITDADWANRRRTWDKIFKKDERPGHAGLVFEIIDDSDSVSLAYAVFEKIHNHKAGVEAEILKCDACVKRRAKWLRKENAKRAMAELADEDVAAHGTGPKYGKGRGAKK